MTYEHRRYGGIDPAFLVRRIDNQYNVNVGATYALSKELSVTPQITYTDNQSNAGLSDYHREMFSVTIRRNSTGATMAQNPLRLKTTSS